VLEDNYSKREGVFMKQVLLTVCGNFNNELKVKLKRKYLRLY